MENEPGLLQALAASMNFDCAMAARLAIGIAWSAIEADNFVELSCDSELLWHEP
jgi:hypothetical protein